MPDGLSWRDRVARAAAADVGRAADEKTISHARELADRWLSGAALGLCAFAAMGAFIGYATTAIRLRPVDGQVDVVMALLVIVGLPWLCLALRGIAMLLVHSRASLLLLDWLASKLLLRGVGQSSGWGSKSRELAEATARRIASMLAAGSGACWTVYALVAGATIWIVTSRIAVGFGWEWESSSLPPHFGRAVVEVAAAPLGALIGSDELTPIAPAPTAPAGDPVALAARRAWLRFLTTGVAVYVLLPMVLWTLWQIWMLRQVEHWRPEVALVSRSATTITRCRREPVAEPSRPCPAGGGACTHVVRLERPEDAVAMPAPLDIAVGGVSLGGFAVLGAVGSVLGAAGASSRKVLRRLRGRDEVRLGDAGVELLAARAIATIRAMLARGHAAVEPVSIESAVKESFMADTDPAWRASWALARGRAAWSDLSRPRPNGVAGHARAETVGKVAVALAGRIDNESRVASSEGCARRYGMHTKRAEPRKGIWLRTFGRE